MSTVTFVGGSLDLTRRAVDSPLGPNSSFRTSRLFPSSVIREGEPYPESVSYYEEVYHLYTASDRAGNDVFVYVFQCDTKPQAVQAEAANLRKSLKQADLDKAALTDRVAELKNELGAMTADRDSYRSEAIVLCGRIIDARDILYADDGDKPSTPTRRPRAGNEDTTCDDSCNFCFEDAK